MRCPRRARVDTYHARHDAEVDEEEKTTVGKVEILTLGCSQPTLSGEPGAERLDDQRFVVPGGANPLTEPNRRHKRGQDHPYGPAKDSAQATPPY
jgi:hypothetical protein